jgi:hypothetical protein
MINKFFCLVLLLTVTACEGTSPYYPDGIDNMQSCHNPGLATERAYVQAEQDVKQIKFYFEKAKQELPKNPAFKNDQCVMPEKRPLPARPKIMSDEQIALQSIGSCLDLSARRMPSDTLFEALASVRQEHMFATYQKWLKSEHASCAMINRSQFEDFIVLKLCKLGGNFGVWACTQDLIASCIQQATASCRAPLTEWENEVAQIKAEPAQLLKKCQEDMDTIANGESRIARAQAKYQLNKEENDRIRASLPEGVRYPAFMPAHCL